MKKLLFVSLLFTSFLAFNSSYADTTVWNFDKAHSNFYFSVDHIFAKVNGHFEEFTGTIRFDADNLIESKFIFEIEVDSINTHNGKRDKHLRSEDFFNESKFPLLRFESSEITSTGGNTYDVKGKFSVKGKDYDITLPLILVGIQDHPMMKNTQVAGFNGTLSIDRLEYGVGTGKYYEAGVVGKDVEILVSLELLNKK